MKSLSEMYRKGTELLRESCIENPEHEALILLSHFTGADFADVRLFPEREYADESADAFFSAVNDRITGRPLQYIIGQWDFMGYTFSVGEGVLIPRPETEELTEYTVKKAASMKNPVIYDLCSGSGCIGLSIMKMLPDSRVFMVEISDEALFYLNKNREKLGFGYGGCVIKGDVLSGYESFSALPRPDIIISNPPYIKKDEIPFLQREVLREPSLALDGGEDGYVFYRAISTLWLPYLNDGGFVAVECGEEQGDKIASLFMAECDETEIICDFSGTERFVIGKKEKRPHGT